MDETKLSSYLFMSISFFFQNQSRNELNRCFLSSMRNPYTLFYSLLFMMTFKNREMYIGETIEMKEFSARPF